MNDEPGAEPNLDSIRDILSRLENLEDEASAIRRNITEYFKWNHSDEFAAVQQNMALRRETGERLGPE
jgi:hypothetical protein